MMNNAVKGARTNRRVLGLLALIGTAAVFLLTPTIGFGYPVPPLPAGNLIQNPWFRSGSNPTEPGQDHWTPEFNEGVTWGLSQKDSNPSPDTFIAGKCGNQNTYCGTGARWANDFESGDTVSYPGVDVFIYQIVQTDQANRELNFFMYFVNHRLNIGEAVIYGANGANGPWEQIWVPVSITQDRNPGPDNAPGRNGNPWFSTPMVSTVLDQGYPFYKILLHANYPESNTNQGDVGIKVTGVYFTVKNTNEPGINPTSWVVYNPTLLPSGETVSQGNATPAPQGTADPATQPANTEAGVVEPTQPPAATATQPGNTEIAQAPATQPAERTREATATSVLAQLTPTPAPAGGNGLIIGFLAGLFGAGVVVIAVQVIRMVVRKG